MRKYRERLFGGPRHAAPLLERNLTWLAFVPAQARALWRRMADRHVATKGEEFGVRAGESIVDAINSVAIWLREEVEPRPANPILRKHGAACHVRQHPPRGPS